MNARDALLGALQDATDGQDFTSFETMVDRALVGLRERGYVVRREPKTLTAEDWEAS